MLLTIGIPTYNRSSYLEENLTSLLPQLKGYEDDIEFVISDNASIDKTEEVIINAINTYSFPIKYYKQAENIGAEENGLWVVEHAIGKYVFLMGDDDILSPNFIEIILPFLKSNNDYDSIHWNRLSGNAFCSNNTVSDPIFNGKVIEELTASDYIKRVLDQPNFISSIIFKKEIIEVGSDYYKDSYFGYRFCGPLYWGLIISGGQNLYYYLPLVIQRNPNKTWIQYWPQYCISSMSNLFYDLDEKVPGVYDKWIKKLRSVTSSVIPCVAQYRNYYRLTSVKEMMFRHMSTWEKCKFYFYLIPGSYMYYRIKAKTLHIITKILG